MVVKNYFFNDLFNMYQLKKGKIMLKIPTINIKPTRYTRPSFLNAANTAIAKAKTICDSFVKTPENAAQKFSNQFSQILNPEDLPMYKNKCDFKESALPFARTPEERAYLFNSSSRVQKKTLECINKINDYLQGRNKNFERGVHTIRTSEIHFKNGVVITVAKAEDANLAKTTPIKTLELRLKDSKEKLKLLAYSHKCDEAISKTFKIVNNTMIK